MADDLAAVRRAAARLSEAQDDLDRCVALAQADGYGVRALGEALGVSKSKACVIAQRGRERLSRRRRR